MARQRNNLARNQSGGAITDALDGIRADYNAAKQSRFRRHRTGVAIDGSGADYHYRWDCDYLRMLELFRDFERNDVVVSQGVSRLVDNVIQKGFTLDPNTGDKTVDKRLVAKWNEWAWNPDSCDIAGEHDFCSLSKTTFRRTIVDGDVLNLGTAEGPLQQIEAHRLRSPLRNLKTAAGVVHGVMLDERRRRVEYWITRDDIDPNQLGRRLSDFIRVRTRDDLGHRQVFHVFNPNRITQTRGVSALAPIVDVVGMHDDIQFAALVKQQLAACFVIFRKRYGTDVPGSPAATGETSTESLGNGMVRALEGVSPGLVIDGQDGEELQGFSPNIPGAGFKEHSLMMLSFIAINLNLPVAVLLLDPSNTNFSGWRGAIDQARQGFVEMQRWMIARHYQPIYEWKVRQWLADEEFRDVAERHAMGDINAIEHTWHPPAWSYIEPLKDATADLLIRSNGLNSPRRICALRATTWDDTSREIIEDNDMAIRRAKEAAAKLNQDFPTDPITWRDLLPTGMPQGVQISLNANDTSQPAGDESDD